MNTPEQDRLIDQYVAALNNMTLVQMAHRLTPFVAQDVAFRDPRLSANGHDALTQAFASLFDGTQGIIFRVTDRAWGQDGFTVYLRWDRLLKLPNDQKCAYSGVSEIMIGTHGKIASIIDRWDPADHQVSKTASLLSRLLNR